MPNFIMMSFINMNVAMLSFVILNVAMLSFVVLNVTVLIAIMLNVVAPTEQAENRSPVLRTDRFAARECCDAHARYSLPERPTLHRPTLS
jgi:hypothetical protein